LRSQVLGIEGEGKTYDGDLMELKPVFEAPLIEVPDDHISLETHKSLLAAGDVFAVRRDSNYRHLIVMTTQESLLAGEDMADDDSRAERVD
jgi:hypothetical protein